MYILKWLQLRLLRVSGMEREGHNLIIVENSVSNVETEVDVIYSYFWIGWNIENNITMYKRCTSFSFNDRLDPINLYQNKRTWCEFCLTNHCLIIRNSKFLFHPLYFICIYMCLNEFNNLSCFLNKLDQQFSTIFWKEK